MLILKRKIDQKIIITLPSGQEIKLVVNEVKQGQASIGIDAPQAIKILREELI